MVYKGKVKNGVVVLEGPSVLPEGAVVEVTLADPAEDGPTLYERLASVVGTIDDLPEDLARHHDHYIHGLPKR